MKSLHFSFALNYLKTDTRTNTAFGTCIIGIDNLF